MFYDLISGSAYLGVATMSTPGFGQPQINGLSLATLGQSLGHFAVDFRRSRYCLVSNLVG